MERLWVYMDAILGVIVLWVIANLVHYIFTKPTDNAQKFFALSCWLHEGMKKKEKPAEPAKKEAPKAPSSKGWHA